MPDDTYSYTKDPRKDMRPPLSTAIQHLAQAMLDIETSARHATGAEKVELRAVWGWLKASKNRMIKLRVENPNEGTICDLCHKPLSVKEASNGIHDACQEMLRKDEEYNRDTY